jgi:hypothetical protein
LDDWGLFRECLGGFAACGLLRETTPNHPPSPDEIECHGVDCISKCHLRLASSARLLAKAVSALAICVIMNVIAVGFGDDITDAAARKRIEGYFPGRDVHIIEMLASWYDGGGVHCHTNDQPAL